MIKQVVDELKQTTIAQVVRMISAAGAGLMLVWSFGSPIIKPYVGEAIAKVMSEQGVSPNVFKKVVEQVQEIHDQLEKRDAAFAALSTNQSAILAQNEQTKYRLSDTSKKLDEIINAIIKKQFGQTEVPRQ